MRKNHQENYIAQLSLNFSSNLPKYIPPSVEPPKRLLVQEEPIEMDAAEADLRALWTRKGITEEHQEEMLREIEEKAAPGAQVGPWKLK